MNQQTNMPRTIFIKPYTAKDMSALLHVTPRVFKRLIAPLEEELGIRRGRYFTVKQVELIVREIGLPHDLDA
jgi:hypothetical protein